MGFHDIFGFDPDLLAMVPQPCHAVLLLFPITDASEKAKDTEAAEIQANGQDVSENVREFLFMIFPHCLLYTSPSPRDLSTSRMPSSA